MYLFTFLKFITACRDDTGRNYSVGDTFYIRLTKQTQDETWGQCNECQCGTSLNVTQAFCRSVECLVRDCPKEFQIESKTGCCTKKCTQLWGNDNNSNNSLFAVVGHRIVNACLG